VALAAGVGVDPARSGVLISVLLLPLAADLIVRIGPDPDPAAGGGDR
jgi:hypothetical protein